MSVSGFKKYKRCEVLGKDGVYNGATTEAMLVGSYVDAYIEGTLEEFVDRHPDIFASRGKTKGELKKDYQIADKVCKFIDEDEILQQFLSGDKQTIMTGFIKGVPFKIKMDSYSPHIAINDLKVMATVTSKNGEYYDFITPWGYDIQLACYQEIVFQNTGEKLPCFICAVTKEEPINSLIISIPQDIMDKALYNVECEIERLYAVKMGIEEPIGCGKCKACISKRTETPIISMTEFFDYY